MDLLNGKGISKQIEGLIRGKVEIECFLCMGEFDTGDYAPMMMCMNQHSCCAPCMEQLLKNDANRQISCPHCNAPIVKKTVTKNRLLITIYEIVKAYKKMVIELEDQIDSLKKASNFDMKTSLLSRNPIMANSFIMGRENNIKLLGGSTLFDDYYPTSKSQIFTGIQKRKENLLAYAERQKIEQLKKVAKSEVPFQQVTKIRSGYGCIKKIQCMEYFTNLRELLLYNNHIRTIEGLNNNIKLNVLSLAYNKIQKIENIGHLKELKRLSVECNKIGKTSAQFMMHYDWKNLESLTISFHEEDVQDNEDCFVLLFGSKCSNQWQNLKTLYIYNSKNVGERGRSTVKEYASRRKTALQIYWS